MAVFLGTPAAAVPALAALADVADVDLVVTRPDKPAGRRGEPQPPPVKVAAEQWGMAVAQPHTREELVAVLREASPEIALVVAYGRILPPEALSTSRLGFVNVHFSLLPRWRGAAPVEHAMAAGDAVTGVSLMLIEEGLDTGPVLAAIETPIADDETGGSLTARLAYLGARMVDDVFPDFVAGRITPAPQLAGGVTEAPPLSREDARIDGGWTIDAALRAVRAFRPRPGAWMDVDGEPLKVHEASPTNAIVERGTVQAVQGRPVAGLDGGSVELRIVRPSGGRAMSGRAWMNGRRGAAGKIGSPAP